MPSRLQREETQQAQSYFILTQGTNLGGREGGRDNETEQGEEEGRWDAGLISAVKLLQWAGGQRFSRTVADHCNTLHRPSPKRV